MVIAELDNEHDQSIHSPTSEVPPRPAFGYSRDGSVSEYSGAGDRPAFGLAPSQHLYPEAEIDKAGGPFGLPTKKRVEHTKHVPFVYLGLPHLIPDGGRRKHRS